MGFINQHWFITGLFSWLSQVMKSKSPIFPSLIFTHTHHYPQENPPFGALAPPFVTDFTGSSHRPPRQCCCYMGCPDLGDTKWPVVQDILGKQTYDSLIYIYICMENHHVYWYITYKYNYRYITIYIHHIYIYWLVVQ